MSKKPTHAEGLKCHNEAPFAIERDRYLRYCEGSGATPGSLSVKRNELIKIARALPENPSQGVNIGQLQEMARQRRSKCSGITIENRVITIGRPWLRFLGWRREPITELPFQNQLDSYVSWMRDERGFSPCTVGQWQGRIKQFLQL